MHIYTRNKRIVEKTKQRAGRNRTLCVKEEEIVSLEKQIYGIESLKTASRDDIIINGDLFECMDYIPNEYFDLIIIDPPYNLDKNFIILICYIIVELSKTNRILLILLIFMTKTNRLLT